MLQLIPNMKNWSNIITKNESRDYFYMLGTFEIIKGMFQFKANIVTN